MGLTEPSNLLLSMRGISKSFPGVQALEDAEFGLRKGEVHALIGENGAGKTTLMNILNGVHEQDSGEILLNGEKRDIQSPVQAQELGISFVHQELNLIPPLSVTENVILGHEPIRGEGNLIDWGKAKGEVSRVMDRLSLELDLDESVENLPIAEQQLVEIAKALYLEAEILVMDEPTSALNEEEVEKLFKIITELKSSGHSIIFISHRLEEVFEIGDRVTVLRNGRYVDTKELSETDRDELVSLMVGEELDKKGLHFESEKGEALYEVEDLTMDGIVRNVSFSLREGEVLGIAGLQGSGRTELLEALFGDRDLRSGRIFLEGEEVRIKSPAEAIDNGIAYLPDDRQTKGLFLNQDVGTNISSASLSDDAYFGVLNVKKQVRKLRQIIEDFGIETAGIDREIKHLSGGNKQKSILAKCLKPEPRVILMNEPTRGIDVGAKAEVYRLMKDLAKGSNVGIIMVSSELPELMDISDKIVVLHEGSQNGIFTHEEADKETLMAAMTGG